MRYKLLSVFLLAVEISYSQQNITKKQQQHLYEVSQLWGNIKYFHPWLQYKKIPWDSAFVAITPSILHSQSTEQYFEQLQKLVSVLGDGATTVSRRKPKLNYLNTQQGAFTIKDSICIVRVNSKKMADAFSEARNLFTKVSESLRECKGVIFDLRITEPGSAFIDPDAINMYFDYTGLTRSLLKGNIVLPGVRAVLTDGFRSERPPNAGYNNYFTISPSTTISGNRDTPLKIIFLVNQNTLLPHVAITLQTMGLAGIACEGKGLDKQTAVTLNYYIDDSIKVTMRKTELVDENGLLKLVPNIELEEDADYGINLIKALKVLENNSFAPYDANVKGSFTGSWKADHYNNDFYPSLGYRVLAAAKMYNIIHFFYPDKDLMDTNWDSTFFKYLPRYVKAKDSIEYAQAVTSMYAHIQDSHGFVAGEMAYNAVAPFVGYGSTPAFIAKKIENKVVISKVLDDSISVKEGFEKGDIVLKTGNIKSEDLVEQLREFYPGSNIEAQNRNIVPNSFEGDENKSSPITIQKKNGQVKIINILHNSYAFERRYLGNVYHDPFRNPLPVCKIFPGNVGYVDMLQLTIDNVDSIMNLLRFTKGIIFDDRCYPPWATQQLFHYLPQGRIGKGGLSGVMVDADVIQTPDGTSQKNITYMFTEVPKPVDRKWLYKGKVVVLMNEYTQSAAEALAGKLISCGATSVGSHTAGANGDITNFNLPGLVNLSFSGHKPFNGNGTTMQRVGIIPKIKVQQTLQGFREGRDDVLDRGIKFVLNGK